MSKITFDDQVPAEVRAAAEPIVMECEWLIPGWCSRVYIDWGDSEGQVIAETTVQYGYRFARIKIMSGWLLQSPEYRKQSVRHEFLHITVHPLADTARFNLKILLEKKHPKFYNHLFEDLTERIESVVQDLALALEREV